MRSPFGIMITSSLALLMASGVLFSGILWPGPTYPAPSPAPVVTPTPIPNEPEPAPIVEDEPIAPEPVVKRAIPEVVKGIFVSAWTAGYSPRMNHLIDLVNRTELNAMVIDVKDDVGDITYISKAPMVEEIGANNRPRARYFDDLMATLQEHNIYTIARITVFKDPVAAAGKPAWALKTATGHLWRDRTGAAWLDPYNEEVWDYIIGIAKEAAEKGFDEIQWDYVRFPSDGPIRDIVYPAQLAGDTRSRTEVIRDFLAYARAELEPLGIPISADVFGLVTSAEDDLGIGQTLLLADYVDALSAMTYPSHYGSGAYGLSNPNAHPYEVLARAMQDAQRRLGPDHPVVHRPWLQDFTMGTPAYGPEQVRAQIRAVEDQGITQWLLWSPTNNYTEGALRPQ